MKHWVLLVALLGFSPLVTSATCPKLANCEADKLDELTKMIASSTTSPEEKGLAIVQMADCRDTGWKDSEAQMLMILRNRQGRESKREVRVRTMEVDCDGDKGLSIFDTPRDVKGTAVLTFSHALEPDHQWIYLPALKRVKRISSKNKSGPFMGSEFAYEDIASQEVDKYTYKYLRIDVYNGMFCYVVERKPAYKFSGYKRQEAWFDKKHFNPQQVIYYDRKWALLKTLTFKDYQQYLGTYWRANEMFMQNHQTGKSTKLLWEEYQFGNDFSERDFDQTTLKRLR